MLSGKESAPEPTGSWAAAGVNTRSRTASASSVLIEGSTLLELLFDAGGLFFDRAGELALEAAEALRQAGVRERDDFRRINGGVARPGLVHRHHPDRDGRGGPHRGVEGGGAAGRGPHPPA